jgi:hypothetical protein
MPDAKDREKSAEELLAELVHNLSATVDVMNPDQAQVFKILLDISILVSKTPVLASQAWELIGNIAAHQEVNPDLEDRILEEVVKNLSYGRVVTLVREQMALESENMQQSMPERLANQLGRWQFHAPEYLEASKNLVRMILEAPSFADFDAKYKHDQFSNGEVITAFRGFGERSFDVLKAVFLQERYRIEQELKNK